MRLHLGRYLLLLASIPVAANATVIISLSSGFGSAGAPGSVAAGTYAGTIEVAWTAVTATPVGSYGNVTGWTLGNQITATGDLTFSLYYTGYASNDQGPVSYNLDGPVAPFYAASATGTFNGQAASLVSLVQPKTGKPCVSDACQNVKTGQYPTPTLGGIVGNVFCVPADLGCTFDGTPDETGFYFNLVQFRTSAGIGIITVNNHALNAGYPNPAGAVLPFLEIFSPTLTYRDVPKTADGNQIYQFAGDVNGLPVTTPEPTTLLLTGSALMLLIVRGARKSVRRIV
jgi:hypothetical protein